MSEVNVIFIHIIGISGHSKGHIGKIVIVKIVHFISLTNFYEQLFQLCPLTCSPTHPTNNIILTNCFLNF